MEWGEFVTRIEWKNSQGCPRLFLAPMEGVGDRYFRRAMASIGGFDEASTEFLRVPSNACHKTIRHIASLYDPLETAPIPQTAQVMGGDPELLAAVTEKLALRGAHRIDLNCGCPSNKVVGRGAGSSLLKDPSLVYNALKAMRQATDRLVTAKIRSGYQDTSLFLEILKAAEESGIDFLVIHPRTKEQGYQGMADWQLIAEAKRRLKIPVVASGDVKTVSDALRLREETACDGVMIGRGALINPLLFLEIKAHYARQEFVPSIELILAYLRRFKELTPLDISGRGQLNRLKQIFSHLFLGSERLLAVRSELLSLRDEADLFFEKGIQLLQQNWERI
jgi:tRNA-dihydrouridine synthase C